MPGPHGGQILLVAPCAFCEAPTDASCRLCGRPMCEVHAIEGEDVCVGCATARALE